MDASTALRFHFGELVISVLTRYAQVLGIGVGPLSLSVWQSALLMEVMFHHSNVRLSPALERRLGRWIVTPRIHGIHHSVLEKETNSNWSSGLAIWDTLHGTFHLGSPGQEIMIGLPGFREPDQVVLPKLLVMPFTGRQMPGPPHIRE